MPKIIRFHNLKPSGNEPRRSRIRDDLVKSPVATLRTVHIDLDIVSIIQMRLKSLQANIPQRKLAEKRAICENIRSKIYTKLLKGVIYDRSKLIRLISRR